MLLSCVAEKNLARADVCQAQSSHFRLQKLVVIDLSTLFQKSSGGNAGLMESVEGRTMKLSSLPLFPQPLEIAKSGDSHITHRTTATAYILTILLGEHPCHFY
jgi:hypothetical protein